MEVALGMLHWAPHEFWAATPHELSAAMAGLREFTGTKKAPAMTRDEYEDMKKRLG